MAKYLQKNWLLGNKERVNTPEQLEYYIFDSDITLSDRTISAKHNIWSQTFHQWLCQLEYNWHVIWKEVFINRHEQLDMVEYYHQFLKKMEVMKPYLVKFEEDSSMK